MIQKKIWVDIPNFKGYQVNNIGEVRSLSRYIANQYSTYYLKGKILSQSKNNKGYLTVWLSKKGSGCRFTVHQLMAICFLNHKPNGNKLVVDHINGIKTDNRLDNLQIITNKENLIKHYKK